MKETLRELVSTALAELSPETAAALPAFTIENTRSKEHGDLACNAAMVAGKWLGKPPREIAQALLPRLSAHPDVVRVEIAGPGFLNFFLAAASKNALLGRVLELGNNYGHSNSGAGKKLTVEFVSANPTGPLHVGHGRGAAYGASLCNILAAVGYQVQREYYVNDYGRQMDILATSLWLRYLALAGVSTHFPENGYRGEYVIEVAGALHSSAPQSYLCEANALLAELPPDAGQEGGDKDSHVDALIARAKSLLGAAKYREIYDFALTRLLAAIERELQQFNVRYDVWFSERALAESGAVAHAIEKLQAGGRMVEREGAQWFLASQFGDEKDRVVTRANGQTTYFASDLAYLLNKFERGFEHAIYVLGADHHGYIARMKAAASGFGINPDRVEIALVQFARLYKDGQEVAMGKRSGSFVTLSDLREEVGTDAARFFYVMRSHEQHLDFDLELAKKQSSDNPVYYVQYAHARICRVFERIVERGLSPYQRDVGLASLTGLSEPREQSLIAVLARFPEVLISAANQRAPHLVANYLRDLAANLHSLYDSPPRLEILCADPALRNARLVLLEATKQVLQSGLSLLGVSAPERM